MNTKQPRSDGVRRIVLTCSVALAVFPVFWMSGTLIGNLGDLSDMETVFCILIGVTSSIVFFLIPRAAKIIYWVIDDFRACLKSHLIRFRIK